MSVSNSRETKVLMFLFSISLVKRKHTYFYDIHMCVNLRIYEED